jgi:hypothetical protein
MSSKETLKRDDQQFHQYQQSKQSPLKSLNTKLQRNKERKQIISVSI